MYDVEKDKVFLENFEREMLEYDEHLTMTLDVYLEYLRYLYVSDNLTRKILYFNIILCVLLFTDCFKIKECIVVEKLDYMPYFFLAS